MRILLLLFALSLPVAAQAPNADPWIGTLEARDSNGLNVGTVTATVALRAGATIEGDWRSNGGASGSIAGTIDAKNRVKATLTFYGGAHWTDDDGTVIERVPERCQGEASAEGALYASGVLRLTVSRIRFDTPSLRALGRHCENLTNVVLTLQPHKH